MTVFWGEDETFALTAKNRLFRSVFSFTIGGPDGGLSGRYQPPLILPPQTKVEEALLLLEFQERKSIVLADE